MKKLFLFISVMLFAAFAANAQNQALPALKFSTKTLAATKMVNPNDVPQTTEKRNCGTIEHLDWMKQQDPTLEAKMNAEEAKFNDYIASHQQELENNKTAYTLPVVVHVVYSSTTTSGGYVGITQVNEQITQTNSDWAGTNGRSMGAFSSTLRANSGITLCLATKDPSGNTTNGIDYKQTTVTSFSTNDYVKQTSHGGAAAWDPTKYLNIWVCNLGSSLCGYAQFPTSGINSTYGVVCHAKYFGHTGATAPYNLGGTISHEFGHCFNLYHTWGDDNGACTGSDNCTDTPPSAGMNYGNIEDGSLSESQGGGTSSINTSTKVETDNCVSSSPGVLYQDFMDYTDDKDYACMTANQATRMQQAVASYLTTVANNAATVCNVTPQAPVAAFTWAPTTAVVNTVTQFTDQSTNTPTGWSWTFGDGGTSTIKNPTHTYTTAGTVNACLVASNAVGSSPQVCHSIVVSSTPTASCDTLHYPMTGTPVLYSDQGGGYVAGNNSYGDKVKAEYFATYSPYTQINGVYLWFGAVKHTGSTTNITINVYNNSGTSGAPGTVIGSATVPLSTILTNFNASTMTGVAFTSPITIPGPFYIGVVLPTVTGDTLALVSNTDGDTSPGTAWEQFTDNTWHAFTETPASWGINVSLGIFPIVCTGGTVGIAENTTLENVLIYPNPANEVLNIDLTTYAKTDVKVDIYDAMGQLVKSMNGNSQTLQVDMSNQISGIYYVTLTTSEGTITRKVSLIK